MNAHPIERLRRAGVGVSINADDPALLDTCLEHEYALCRDQFSWSDDDVRAAAEAASAALSEPQPARVSQRTTPAA